MKKYKKGTCMNYNCDVKGGCDLYEPLKSDVNPELWKHCAMKRHMCTRFVLKTKKENRWEQN